jgi:hypothetical protein
MTYRAEPITQRDGSELENSNCLMAAAAMGIDMHTHGRITSTGDAMRDRSGDTSGGTNTDEVVRAWKAYGEQARDRDGHTWDEALDELWDGRGLMLQVWHATTGGPCLSGSGAYGHGLAIAAEQRTVSDGSRQWLVSDPWCKPPKWAWWDQSRLKAGAEEWVRHAASGAGGDPDGDPRRLPLHVLQRLAAALMARYDPAHPGPEVHLPPLGAGGPVGILYASTDIYVGGSDVAIQAPSSLHSDYVLELPEGTPYYGDSELTDKYSELTGDRELPYVGLVVGGKARAVVLSTSGPYEGDEKKPTVVYVPKDAAEPTAIEPCE